MVDRAIVPPPDSARVAVLFRGERIILLMARPTQDVTVSDIQLFLTTASDFTFELNVLKRLVDLGLHCQHGGTYDDPITQKTRQFDIQAESDSGDNAATVFRFAFECKNLRATFPLLMHRVPRAKTNHLSTRYIRQNRPTSSARTLLVIA